MGDSRVKVIDGDLNVLGIINQKGMPLPTIEAVGEYNTIDDFPRPGQSGVIYIDLTENLLYRWDTATEDYVQISRDLEYYYRTDNVTTAINYTLRSRIDQTFTELASSIKLVVPENMYQGFEAGCVVKTGDAIPSFEIENNSEFPVKMVQFGVPISSYTPATNSTITFLFYNDNINNNLLIYEVHD